MNNNFMQQAITLGLNAINEGTGGPFGAVIVQNNKIIGRGQNTVLEKCDPTAHAEVNAIRDACDHIKNFELKNCDIYTSCEPCTMCLGAIYWSRLAHIYYAANRTDAAAIGFDDEYIYQEFEVNQKFRKLPMIEVQRQDAIALFKKWQIKGCRSRSEHKIKDLAIDCA